MADKDPGDGPSLELPKLFGRKKDRGSRGRTDDGPSSEEGISEVERAEPAAPAPEQEVDPAEVTMPLPAPGHPQVTPDQATVAEPPAAPGPASAPEPAPAAAPSPAAASAGSEPPPVTVEAEPRRRREPSLPAMPTSVAAVVVGALVGVLGIGLTWLGLLGCEAVRGTESCGGPGLLVMLAIMVAMVVAGAALLRLLGVPQSGSLSFLGFGILAVVVLMFLLDHLDNLWVLVSIPVISALGYGVAHWVTTRFTEPDPDFTH